MPFADFGPLVTYDDIDRAMSDTLKLWLPTYLTQIEAERGLTHGFMARPKPSSYATAVENEGFPDQKLPVIVVTSAQTEGQPEDYVNNFYSAGFQVVVSAVVRSTTKTGARSLASLYAGSIARLVVQQGTLGTTFVSKTQWRSGGVSRVQPNISEENRELAAGMNIFTVFVDDMMHSQAGPLLPGPDYPDPDPTSPDTPYDPLVTVHDVVLDVNAAGGS